MLISTRNSEVWRTIKALKTSTGNKGKLMHTTLQGVDFPLLNLLEE
jgi:hypothetical protein